MKILAICLLVIGFVMTIITGFNIVTEKEVLDIGSIEINKKDKTPVYWSPVTGVVLVGIGAVVLFFSKKGKEA
ncbi:MAG TPA: hypothetical protein VFW11_14665 [Cyclobacteriaceae bacterium]|nr:hypothetical protein [Cyclobacteriaceae bacterium]